MTLYCGLDIIIAEQYLYPVSEIDS